MDEVTETTKKIEDKQTDLSAAINEVADAIKILAVAVCLSGLLQCSGSVIGR